VKSLYERERRQRANKDSNEMAKKKKPAGKRDQGIVYHDAFTREQILKARGMSDV
jgi:hypothetical protein